jgi:hypothetical protein
MNRYEFFKNTYPLTQVFIELIIISRYQKKLIIFKSFALDLTFVLLQNTIMNGDVAKHYMGSVEED